MVAVVPWLGHHLTLTGSCSGEVRLWLSTLILFPPPVEFYYEGFWILSTWIFRAELQWHQSEQHGCDRPKGLCRYTNLCVNWDLFCFSLNNVSAFSQRSFSSGPLCVPLISARWQRTWSCTAPRSSPSSPSLMPTGGLCAFVQSNHILGSDNEHEIRFNSQEGAILHPPQCTWKCSLTFWSFTEGCGVWPVCVLNCNNKKRVIWSSRRQTLVAFKCQWNSP